MRETIVNIWLDRHHGWGDSAKDEPYVHPLTAFTAASILVNSINLFRIYYTRRHLFKILTHVSSFLKFLHIGALFEIPTHEDSILKFLHTGAAF